MKPQDIKDYYDSVRPDEKLEYKVLDRLEKASNTAAGAPHHETPPAKSRRLPRILIAAAATIALALFILLPSIRVTAHVSNDSLVSFKSYAQAESYVRKQQSLMHKLNAYGCGFGFGCAGKNMSGGAPESPGEGYSTTNTQVDGVDEADTVKTNGRHIYRLAADGGDAIVHRIDTVTLATDTVVLTDSEPLGLYLTDTRLLVLASVTDKAFDGYNYRHTRLSVYDITAAPTLLTELTYPAAYRDSRRVDDKVYLVMSDYQVTNDDKLLIPCVRRDGTVTQAAPTDIFAVPGPSYSNQLTYLAVVDASGTQTGLKAYFGTFDTLYMCGETVYTAATDYTYKRGVFGYSRGGASGTVVNRFSVTEAAVEYASTARVDGTALNSFCMDEYDGYFRIATSLSDGGARLTVLDTADLKETARVDGMGKENNERIYAVRFDGDICYLVTARQTDPLYLVDLTDATAPKVTAELKIPDVSDYMHLYDEHTVIGVGRQAYAGAFYGLQVTLFDVSDRANPTKLDQFLYNRDTYSEITENHRAFLYYTLPSGQTIFGFPIEQNSLCGFTLLSTDGRSLSSLGAMIATKPDSNDPFAYLPSTAVSRAVVVGARVFALADACFITADITTGENLALSSPVTYFYE